MWACLRGQYHPRCLPPRLLWQLQCMTISCHTWQPLDLRFGIFKKFFLAEEMDPSFNLNTNIKVPTPHIFEPNFFALIKSRPSALYYNSFQLVDLQVSQFDILRIFCHHFLTLVIILLCLVQRHDSAFFFFSQIRFAAAASEIFQFPIVGFFFQPVVQFLYDISDFCSTYGRCNRNPPIVFFSFLPSFFFFLFSLFIFRPPQVEISKFY